jgi:hypothetical protein
MQVSRCPRGHKSRRPPLTTDQITRLRTADTSTTGPRAAGMRFEFSHVLTFRS